MMEWTDRHCRFFHRQLTAHALLFTEMVTSGAVVHGNRERLLGFDNTEHPIAVQLGGSNAEELAEAVRICDDYGYDEINLNVGCPSDRVKSGRFGACLMADPELVAKCVAAMKAVTTKPITVKCRIGIDDQEIEKPLDHFIDTQIAAGADAIYVHARKAWLNGLSPKENRTIPPLEYDRVYRLAARLADYPIMINGGIETLAQSVEHLQHTSGVMLGRAAYHDPIILSQVDHQIYGEAATELNLSDLMSNMASYAENHLRDGGRVNQISRHMLGLANGRPGARRFRQILSTDACKLGAGPEVFENALAAIDPSQFVQAQVEETVIA